MPLSSGLSIHDDTKHRGSAKRGLADGIAGLNVNAEIEDVDVMRQKYLSIAMAVM